MRGRLHFSISPHPRTTAHPRACGENPPLVLYYCFNPRSVFTGVRHINVPSITGTTRLLFSGADCPLVGGGYRFAPPATFAFSLEAGNSRCFQLTVIFLIASRCRSSDMVISFLFCPLSFMICQKKNLVFSVYVFSGADRSPAGGGIPAVAG